MPIVVVFTPEPVELGEAPTNINIAQNNNVALLNKGTWIVSNPEVRKFTE